MNCKKELKKKKKWQTYRKENLRLISTAQQPDNKTYRKLSHGNVGKHKHSDRFWKTKTTKCKRIKTKQGVEMKKHTLVDGGEKMDPKIPEEEEGWDSLDPKSSEVNEEQVPFCLFPSISTHNSKTKTFLYENHKFESKVRVWGSFKYRQPHKNTPTTDWKRP